MVANSVLIGRLFFLRCRKTGAGCTTLHRHQRFEWCRLYNTAQGSALVGQSIPPAFLLRFAAVCCCAASAARCCRIRKICWVARAAARPESASVGTAFLLRFRPKGCEGRSAPGLRGEGAAYLGGRRWARDEAGCAAPLSGRGPGSPEGELFPRRRRRWCRIRSFSVRSFSVRRMIVRPRAWSGACPRRRLVGAACSLRFPRSLRGRGWFGSVGAGVGLVL